MTDDDLLAQIAAAPDDDAPRAVYADLLLQRGDPRGEFIQLQLAHADSDREHELLRAHEAAWNDAAGVRGAGASYQRGFIASLWGSPATIVASREALRTQPIVRLSLEPDGEFAALVRLRLATGRTHQIRVHAADHGWPLLGDVMYGRTPPKPLAPLAKQLGRQALHAAVLAFAHPVTGAPLRFESPLPPDMVAVLEALR